MTIEEQGSLVSGDVWGIYPLLYLDAAWTTAKEYYFDLDVRLIRADKRLLEQFESSFDNAAPLVSEEVLFDPKYRAVLWVLAVRIPEATQHVPIEDVGVSFSDRVEDGVVESFQTCLNMVRSTPVTAPFRYAGTLRGATVTITGGALSAFEETGDTPGCYWPSAFTEADLPVLSEVWSGIVKVRQLRKWMSEPFTEEMFGELDRFASERAEHELFGLYSEIQEIRERQPDEDEAAYREYLDLSRDAIEMGVEGDRRNRGEWWREEYRSAFLAEFRKYQDNLFNSESRVGRALGIFESGIHLPPLHAFLSACLVLETLFTVEGAEVAHKMATRLVKMLARDAGLAERRDLYRRFKRMYRGRSEVVHGSKSIVAVEEEVRKAAPEFAQQALQTILRDEKLVRLYTQDAKGERGEGGLVEFLEGLDLSGSIGL